MKVARHPAAAGCLEACKKGNRPVGHGMIRSGRLLRSGTINQPRGKDQTSLRDGRLFGHIPGNELPGYGHSVPPGRILSCAHSRQ
jgi:hypothetical protein